MPTGVAVNEGDEITNTKMNLKLETVENADVAAEAAMAWTKLAALAETHILVGDAGNDAVDVAVSGDIGMANDGTVSITGDSIINADVKTDALIAWSKMAGLTAAHLLVGSDGGVATDVAVTGDITIDNGGVVGIAGLAIVNGDISATAVIAWTKMAALTDTHILVGDGSDDAVDVAMSGDISITNLGLTAIAAGVIVNADVKTTAAIEWSKMAALANAHILVGSVAQEAVDVAVTGDVTISNAGVTAIGAAKVDLAMIDPASLDGTVAKVVADDNVIGGMLVLHRIDVADTAGDTDVTLTHKTRVIDAWGLNTGEAAHASTDTWQVKSTGDAISDAVKKTAAVNAIIRIATIDPAHAEIAGGGILRITAAKTTNCAVTVYVLGIRVAE